MDEQPETPGKWEEEGSFQRTAALTTVGTGMAEPEKERTKHESHIHCCKENES